MEKKKNSVLEVLKNFDFVIAGVALIVLICITFFGVIMRYCFGNPFVWQEEVQLWCFVWIIFFGAGAAFRMGNQVAIEIVVDLLPAKIAKIVEFIDYVIVLGILVFVTKQSITLIMQLAQSGRATNILQVPSAFIYSAVPIGCVLMMVSYTSVMVKKMRGISEEEVAE